MNDSNISNISIIGRSSPAATTGAKSRGGGVGGKSPGRATRKNLRSQVSLKSLRSSMRRTGKALLAPLNNSDTASDVNGQTNGMEEDVVDRETKIVLVEAAHEQKTPVIAAMETGGEDEPEKGIHQYLIYAYII